ncbi:MAG: putative membrane protein [Lentimonas sp.]|jgi:uncharacterized membrane protein
MSNKPNKEILEKWHEDPKNWKFNIFYFNKEDKRLFVPKKLKILGWTVNFANPFSSIIIILIPLIYFVSKLNS